MSDWRGGDSKDDKGRKDNRPKSKPLPLILPKQAAPSTGTGTSRKDWRGNPKSRDTVRTEGERTWTGARREKVASTSGLRKFLLVGLLGLGILCMFIGLNLELWKRNPELPVIISISGTHASDDIGENPFGQQTIKQLQDAKPHHLQLISSTEVSDQFINVVKANEDWAKNFSGTIPFAKSGRIKGAGPGKNVMVYFVSCFVARAASNGKQTDEWVLLSRDDDPYWQPSNNSDGQTLPISLFLERVAKQTSAGSYAWIVFDVKPPTVVTNLGDLEFSKAAFDRSFGSLDKQWQDRLILSLPCDESQESWMAPEFSSSVFAHFFWDGIAAGFGTEKGIVTLNDFELKLKQRVQEWVALNRFARQTPTFLVSEATEKSKKDIRLLDMAGKSFPMPPSATKKEDIASKFRELDELWKRFYHLRHCVRWEPMRYAKIESQLIHMEELAECNAQNKWDNFKKRVESDIKNLERDAKFERRVSLIESRLHSLVRPGVFSIDALVDRKSRATPWIVTPTDTNSKPRESDVGNASPPRDVRCLQVWSFLENEAKSGNAGIWEKSFKKTHLSQCLDYCGLQKEQNRNEWLEIQVLRILLDAVKSELDSSKSSEAIARTIETFSQLNEIAFDPNAELSRWTKSQLIDLDKQFLKAFDLVVANQFDPCIQQLKSMQKGIAKLKEDFGTWKEAMATRDEVLWITPHFLAAWMRDYRYTAKGPEILLATRDLQTVLNEAMLIRDSLEDADRPDKSLSLKPSTRQELDKLKRKLNQEFVELDNKTEGDAETIPKIRIALRWPLLPLDLREKFHSRLTKLYSVERSAGNGISDVKHQSPSLVATEFCKGLDDFKGKSFYQNISSNDPRFSSLAMIEKESPQELSTEPSKIVSAIYGVSYSTRMIANSFGQRAAASRPRDEDWRWPWNSATQFDQINTAYYNQLQSERLCLARWGDGNLDTSKPLGKLYFQRLEKEFSLSSQLLKNYDQAKPISRPLDKAYAEYNKNSDTEVRRIGVTIPALERDTESSVPISFESNAWGAIATLSVHRNDSFDRREFSSSDKSKNRSAYIRLDENDKRVNLNMDSRLVAGAQLRVSVRGHYRESPIISKDDTNSYQIRFQRPPTKPSTIRVTAKSDPITMWVLLDCSGSMSVKDIKEPTRNIHEKARESAKSLLEHVLELNESGECPINVGLIAFGRRDNVATPIGWTKSTIGNQIFKTEIKVGAEIGDLIPLVEPPWIQPSGCTPLYDAIYTACEGSKADGRNWIVVISDGSNDVKDDLLPDGVKDDGTYYITSGGNKNKNHLKQKIEESKSSVFIFQFINDRYYDDPKFNSDKKNAIVKANTELRDLLDAVSQKKASGSKSKLFYDDFARLRDDLIASLPYSTVTVESKGQTIGQGRFGKPIDLQVKEPIDATVKIQSFGQSDSTPISLVGSEGLEFNYSDSARLNSIKFSDDLRTHRLGTDFSRMSSGVENGLRVLAKCTPDSDSSLYQLVLQVAIQGTAADNVEQKTFTRRPEFVLAAIKPAGGGPETATLISDSRFLPMTHYPILLFPNIPWKRDGKWLSEQVDFDVWMANELPDKATKISLKSRDQQELFNKQITCKRIGNEVRVQIQSQATERFFVICNSAKAATRTMVEGKETEVKFELQEEDEKPVEVVVLKESELKHVVEQGSVKHYWINEMKFIKR